jgi:Tol biopolymer transport system component
MRRHGFLLAALACAALALLGAHDVTIAKPGGGKPKPPPSPADPAIAYAGDGGLCVMNADGSNQTVILEGDIYDSFSPCWSRDGNHIAFNRGQELWRIDVAVVDGVPQGSNATRIHEGPAYNPQWSPDGSTILFEGGSMGAAIKAVPATGGEVEDVYTPPSNCAVYFPCWSRDGTRIAFFEYQAGLGTALKVLTLGEAQDPEIVLTHDASANFRFLEWGRTDDLLVYDNGSTGDIYTLDLGSGEVTTVVEGNRRKAAMSPCWSPDDAKLVYEQSGIKVLDLSSGSTTTLAGNGRFPDWKR